MYHTTGFSKDEIVDLCALVHATGMSSGGNDGYPPVLGLFKSVAVTLTYRHRATGPSQMSLRTVVTCHLMAVSPDDKPMTIDQEARFPR
jgi:hypothetical protein